MLKRPISAQFRDAVLAGIKTTTIRDNPWPVGVPIMLYTWAGKPYRSKQIDLCAIIVEGHARIHIQHRDNGDMLYIIGHGLNDVTFPDSEGFLTRADLDTWFRQRVPLGETASKALIQFRLAATETHWKCNACPCGTCLTAGTKPRKCVAGMPIMASWQPATPAEYAAAQPT